MIDRYLRELAPLLPRGRRRRRILEEVEAHLRDAAAVVGEQQAVARFGPAAEVAARCRELAADRGESAVLRVLAALVGTKLAIGVALLLPHTEQPGTVGPHGKPMPLDALLAVQSARWIFALLVVAGLAVAAAAVGLGAAMSVAGLLGYGALPVLAILTRGVNVDTSPLGTAALCADLAWFAAALAAVPLVIRARRDRRAAA